jgi:NAD(P)-dependent dehydrogenase (short-subunit alcohol dehydrogenase family)
MADFMSRRLFGKVAIVAGASRGIGAVTAQRLAREGASVVVAAPASEAEDVAAVVEAIMADGGEAAAASFDAAVDCSFSELLADAVNRYGGIDIFHANFADQSIIFEDSHILEAPDLVLDRTMDINLKGMARATRHALPRLLERGGGALIYSSSAAATMGDVERPFYAMSKAGIGALVRHVANRWGRAGIRANAILPGYIMTPAVQKTLPSALREEMQSKTPAPRLGRSEDVAAMVAFLSCEDGEWVNGQAISVDGGLTMR